MEDGLLSADLCLIPKPGKPADKPSQLRPLGILRPDAKGLAGTAREMLSPHVLPFMLPLPQFAYLPGRGLSDAQSRVTQHLREVRLIGRSAKPSREDRKRGLGPPALVGGVTFALDLSQAAGSLCRSGFDLPWSMVCTTPPSTACVRRAASLRSKQQRASNRAANLPPHCSRCSQDVFSTASSTSLGWRWCTSTSPIY